MRTSSTAVFLLAAALIAFPAVRCGASNEVHVHLERDAVQAARTGIPAGRFPVSTSIVTKDEAQMSNANTATDLLGTLPGVFVRKTGAFGRADVDIRGIGDSGRQIGVFIDGRPDKMGLFGCSVTHTLPMNNVERIEVIRGPESVLYGSEAFGGVVNIVTRRPTRPLEGSFTTSAGSFNTKNLRFQQGSRLDAIDYFVSIDKRSSDGHAENSLYNATDYSARFGYALSKNSELSFSGKYFSGIKNEPFPAAAGTWNDYGRGSADLTYKKSGDVTDTSLKVYRTFGEHRFSDGFHSKDHTDGIMLHGKRMLSADNALSAGADFRYQSGDVLNIAPPTMIGSYHKYEYGVYVNDDHTFFEKLTVSAGARYNRDEYSGGIVTPRAGVVYSARPGTVLRGLVSSGFRAPQLNDLYLWSGNKDLKPEKVVNTELGVRQDIGDRVAVDVTGFVMKGTDLIEVRSGKKQNTGEFEFKGLETALNAVIAPWLGARINYTFFDAGRNTAGRPGEKIGASLACISGRFSGTMGGEYVGRYYAADDSSGRIDDYLVVNAKLDYRLLDQLNVFIGLDNITDASYRIFYSGGLYEMPKRSLTAGASYTF